MGIAVNNESVTDTGYHALFQFRNKGFKLINRTETTLTKRRIVRISKLGIICVIIIIIITL